VTLEALEQRSLLSLGLSAHPLVPLLAGNHPAEVRSMLPESQQPGHQSIIGLSVKIESARKRSFSIGQLERFLPGRWRVFYDASSLFGPGAEGAQEITFTGPKGDPTFVSTTGVLVRGLFGPAYYQFSSWGTYRFITKSLLRLTITGGEPTEYLNNGIIIMGGQSMPIQFVNQNQFGSQGLVYNRVPLNSTIF
jgi:hypothetical protein